MIDKRYDLPKVHRVRGPLLLNTAASPSFEAKLLWIWICGACVSYLILPYFTDISGISFLGFRLIYYLPILIPLLILPINAVRRRLLRGDSTMFILFSMHFGFGIVSAILGETPVTSTLITVLFYLSVILMMFLVASIPRETRVSLLALAAIIVMGTLIISIIIGKWRGYTASLRYGFEIEINPNWVGLFVSVAIAIIVCSNMNLFYKTMILLAGILTLNSSQNPGWVVYSILGSLIQEGGDGVSGADR